MEAKNTKVIVLASYPEGEPKLSDFRFEEAPVGEVAENQALLKTTWISVDPYLRGRMNPQREVKSYIPPFEVGKPVVSGIVAEVLASKSAKFNVGDIVTGLLPWQEIIVADEKDLRVVGQLPSGVKESAALGVLGMPGMTAYFGLLEITNPKAGETVVVSGAAGAVGSLVGQIAKIYGCRVVGIAGSDDKVAWLKEIGFDEAINYKTTQDIDAEIKRTCPQGVDIYFDNVGGPISDAVTMNINNNARISICGQIAQYNLAPGSHPQGPRLDGILLMRNAKKEGFIVTKWYSRFTEFFVQMSQWIAEGKLQVQETVAEGFEQTPQAFIDMLRGKNTGKMVVKV